jgi:hypothetical protein
MEYMIYEAQVSPDLTSDLEVNYLGLVEKPAIDKNFQAFKEHAAKFVINEEKKIISGPAMIADLPIYRSDDSLGEYYVVFNKPAIQTIVEKFSAKGYLKNFNLFHDPAQKVDDVTVFNSFIIDTELGINPPSNFTDLPNGSWFITAKVNNEDVWNKVKTGEIKGFSVEGIFTYLPVAKVKMTAEQLAQKIQSLLSCTEITN